jgi:membrane dipeptidase
MFHPRARSPTQWANLAAAHGATIELTGFPLAAGPAAKSACFLVLPEPRCCGAHSPRDPEAAVEVFATSPLPMRAGALRLKGELRVQTGDPDGWRYQLHDARCLDPPGWSTLTRRGVLAGGPLICLAAADARAQSETARKVIAAGPPIDIHSHAGGIANTDRLRSGVGFSPVHAPMRDGGMAAICWAITGDGGTVRLSPEGRLRPYRDPAPGELRDHAIMGFDRILQLARTERLRIIATVADLRASGPNAPGVIISCEGADFLEGRIDGLDEAYRRWTLRHLQLTHYRVNELGDIQTEAPVHGGLTDFGAQVIRRCNQLGIVVDVAHGTFDLVKRAASVTTRPLVLSHTSLVPWPKQYSRNIGPEHAKLIAGTGGVIGVWPPASIFPSLAALATGIARMADVAGIDHVGLGSDMRGLVGPSVFPDYDYLPAFAEALLEAGFSEQDAGKVLGGNYARVFAASLKTASVGCPSVGGPKVRTA